MPRTLKKEKLRTLDHIRGRARVVIEAVEPQVAGGRFAVKRVQGEPVIVEADVFADGHNAVACELLYRHASESSWQSLAMRPLGNDRWTATFRPTQLGSYHFTVSGSIDAFETWRLELVKRFEAQQDLAVAMLVGAELLSAAAARASKLDAANLKDAAERLAGPKGSLEDRYRVATDPMLAQLARRYPDPETVERYREELSVRVDRERARFSTWYELFPRSCADRADRHGTLRDCAARLPYIASMGFDVVYMPPIHPIGKAFRKGRNNTLDAQPGDVGSPWAIGDASGGHKAIHPELGTHDDFRHLVDSAKAHGIEIALDLAYQCSPDHPYVKEHPEWFVHRPDGSIQYAENPPKKYQDIYPLDFECPDWQALWSELHSVIEFWIDKGVQIFRVDNPHTKPFPFWEWVIGEVQRTHPEIIFLAEAFTRPKVMHRLAKAGFTQSYTYFTWRNTKQELIEYLTELTQAKSREYFRPNLWPNTPDILSGYLQYGGRAAFVTRIVLAATLGASYGIYGPVYELVENEPRDPGGEEYLNSEKYELRNADLGRADSLKDLITRLNKIRRESPALQCDWGLRFHPIDNEQLIAYSKSSEDGTDTILVIANLDPFQVQSGRLELAPELFGLAADEACQMHDLLSGARYIWRGASNYVSLDPQGVAAHIFKLRRRVRTERDFDYFT